MRKTRQVPQLNVLLCLPTGSSFYNGKKPVVSMSLKVLKFCQEESYKALCTHNLNYSKAKQKDLWSPQRTSTTLLTLCPFIKYIPFYLDGSRLQLQGHWFAGLEDVHLKWQTLLLALATYERYMMFSSLVEVSRVVPVTGNRSLKTTLCPIIMSTFTWIF